MINIIMIVAFVFLLLFEVLLFQFATRYVYNFKIKEYSIEVVLFGKIPMMRIHFNNIVEIKKTSYKEMMFMISRLWPLKVLICNRIWGELILVRQKKGIFKVVFITTDDADGFIQEVLQRLPK